MFKSTFLLYSVAFIHIHDLSTKAISVCHVTAKLYNIVNYLFNFIG